MNFPDSVVALLLSLTAATSAILAAPATTPAAVAPSAGPACRSVSCESFVVIDGPTISTPCINHGCGAGCSPGPSNSTKDGGGWSTCKCGGQVEPRCCHVIFRVDYDLLTYEVESDGDCGSQNSNCPGGTKCGFWKLESIDGSFKEFGAICFTPPSGG